MSTFGRTSLGASSALFFQNRINGCKATLSEDGDVTKLTIHCRGRGTGGNSKVRGVIYTDSSGPDALRGVTSEVTVLQDAAEADVDLTFSSAVSLTAGDYWLMLWQGDNGFYIYYDTGASGIEKEKAVAYSPTGNPEDPLTGETDNTHNFGPLYATYTASDTTPPGLATGATATTTGRSGIELDWAAPADADVSQYELRVLAGTSYPATNRSDGTVLAGPAASTPSAAESYSHTGLTRGTVYSYRIFHKDIAGNWNTGATVQARTTAGVICGGA